MAKGAIPERSVMLVITRRLMFKVATFSESGSFMSKKRTRPTVSSNRSKPVKVALPMRWALARSSRLVTSLKRLV